MNKFLKPFPSNILNYALYGAIFGMLFPVISYFIIDEIELLFGIICTAPIFLGVFASIAGYKQDQTEKIVNERTKELEKLLEDAKKSTNAKSIFLASICHEIRTPMNAVLSCSSLLSEDLKDHNHLNLVKIINQSGRSLVTLMDDLLDFSKIESGKVKLEIRTIDMRKIIKETVFLFEHSADENNISLEIKFSNDFPQFIEGDSLRLRQIISNLISNGIKFAKTIVLINATLDVDGKLDIKVCDDGPGVPSNCIANIFKEYSQANESISRTHGGTGLGLIISKGLITQMNGLIDYQTSSLGGACFRINFMAKTMSSHKKVVFKKTEGSNFAIENPLKILLAEDNLLNQKVAKMMFKRLGYNIKIVNNGQECINILKNEVFDLVFMDMRMPIMNGLEATTYIRNTLKLSTPIYALTANTFKKDEEVCTKAGMNGFFKKPLEMELITDQLILDYRVKMKNHAA